VCWIIRNITDPEAIESAIRLAGTIHWFDGDVDVDPPLDFILSTFDACFDPARKLYPGMSDRACSSKRAILRITKAAWLRSRDFSSKHPAPLGYDRYNAGGFNKGLFPGLERFSSMVLYPKGPPSFIGSTLPHSIWMSNLYVDIIQTDPDPHTHTTLSTTKDMTPLDHASDANVILWRLISLGGPVEEETLWADDKSYAVAPSLSLSAQLIDLRQRLFANHSLAPISEDCGRYS
jgi:hypothetical protein